MPPPFRLQTLGVRWEIEVDALEPDVAARLRSLWRDCGTWAPNRSEPPGSPGRLRLVHEMEIQDEGESAQIVLPRDAEVAPYAFSGAVTLRGISAQAGRLTMLHGAALASPRNLAALILIAASGTGKTTAAKHLGRTLHYLSDETAAIREDLTVLPHAKPLSVLDARTNIKHESAPADLGLLPGVDDAWVGATVLLQRIPGEAARLEPVGLIDAIVEAIPQSSSLPEQAHPLRSLCSLFTAGAGVSRLVYGEIEDAIGLLTGLLDRARRGSSSGGYDLITPPDGFRGRPWEAEPGSAEVRDDAILARAPWVDAVRVDDEVLLLNGPRPVRLMGLGSTVWLHTERPRTMTELHDQVVDVHGPHTESQEILRQTVASLLTEGVLAQIY